MFPYPTNNPPPLPQRGNKSKLITAGMIAALVVTVAALFMRKDKPEKPEAGSEPTKAQDLAQAEKKRLMAEMGRKGGKKSAEARRKQKPADEVPADELQP